MNDITKNQNLKCTSCGVPYVDHLGIIGTCAENIKLKAEVAEHEMWDNLNEELWDRRTEMTQMKIVIAQLRKERDDARLMYCEFQFLFNNPNKQMNLHKLTALEKGWDCYKDTL